jgi:Rieske Fe-S protein
MSEQFPIRQDSEAEITRRQFARMLGLGAVALAGGTWWATRDHVMPSQPPAPLAVAALDELPVKGSKQFRYPTEHDPCILVRLSETEFVAYDQRCTHLSCPVHYRAETNQFVCPCHAGYFNAADGAVLAGPPPRPLRRLNVVVRDGQIWIQA